MQWIENLAIWFLKKREVSVVMNFDVTGDIKERTSKGRFENCLIKGRVYDHYGHEFIVPHGKFKISYDSPYEDDADD
ncbi:hypothetical protein [Lactiplantibacillus mudanjiangensis]|uniref:Uncharacterized protein n=1 Tax=Lactiplantibacillus mudanjiangensis TaxID=1296538 RepID=A0A660DXK8_9LACO|nr:hypothetical protein [Lactiplantibacillus mudanjiangensis]VDG26011.1 hypothetical protein MUDAN_IGPPGNFN_03538 [Lactiplantibacillus mudanjiangensis]VDG27891.1 hypothetical protein MUDAN_MDHGFNIF_02708 [Lactiplantibacillus mudanjiangensis]